MWSLRALVLLLGFTSLVACAPRSRTPSGGAGLAHISAAPEFALPDETGKLRALSEFRGHALVLYFYPKDGTPGCTREACAFRDEWQRLSATGALVVGVSLDSVESHAAFKRMHALPFPLLSDAEGRVLAAYGVPKDAKGYASRTTFIIDAQGVIRRIFPEVDPAVHVNQVLETLAELKRLGLHTAPAPATPLPRGAESCQTPTAMTSPATPTFVYFIEPRRPEMVSTPTADEEAMIEKHFQYLKGLTERGVLILAGPSTDPPHTGIVVFRAADRPAAEAILGADPAVQAGVFSARLSAFRVSLSGACK
ncbi:MAG: redoxin domain-containing protein [Myxococcales bacterium]|nr:redoxin domain-containing protein [Myxococcales bacterium]